MPIGIGAALLIGSAVSGGAQLYAAHEGANAVKDAAAAQTDAAKQAIALEQANLQRGQQLLQPWTNLGSQGANQMSQLLQQRPYQPFVPGQPNTFQPPPAVRPPVGVPVGSAPSTMPMPNLAQPPMTLGGAMSPRM